MLHGPTKEGPAVIHALSSIPRNILNHDVVGSGLQLATLGGMLPVLCAVDEQAGSFVVVVAVGELAGNVVGESAGNAVG